MLSFNLYILFFVLVSCFSQVTLERKDRVVEIKISRILATIT
jgi:prepilin signal peptidase PulO-like enzyme (type II secretory pathway)